jgi:TctA family transporter
MVIPAQAQAALVVLTTIGIPAQAQAALVVLTTIGIRGLGISAQA